jgi:hypothetical protein
MSFSDERLEQLGVAPWQPQEIRLPAQVAEGVVRAEDAGLVEDPMSWRFEGRPYSDQFNMVYVADQAALDIIIENAKRNWERPVYFANTTSRDGQLDLQRYFQAEGLAYRLLPIPQDFGFQGRVVPEIAIDRFKTFRFTGLNDSDVHFDENIRRMIDNYRLTFSHAAEQMASAGESELGREMLVSLMEQVPFSTIPGDVYSTISLARAFETLDAPEWVRTCLDAAQPLLLDRLARARSDRDIQQLNQFIQMVQVSYFRNGDFDRAAELSQRIAEIAGDSSVAQTEEELRALYGGLSRSADPAIENDSVAESR